MVMSSERGKNTHNQNYTLIPKNITQSMCLLYWSSLKLIIKIKKTLVQIQPITDINEIKKRDPQKSTVQKFQGTFIYNFPLAYHTGTQPVI